jgi:membrane-associated phospholipid phosphatase
LTTDSASTDHAAGWQPAIFVSGCALSALLLCSWFFEPTRSMWLIADERFFFAVNGWLAADRGRQVFWALANHRAVDLVSASFVIGIFMWYVLRHQRHRIERFLAVGLVITGMLVVAKRIADAFAIAVARRSPTLVHPEAFRLSEAIPDIATKDSARFVFPGDHAMVLIICATTITCYLPRRYAAAAWIAAVAFTAPRLVSGAHWLSDDLVGAVAVAGFVLTYVLATPLRDFFVDRLEPTIVALRFRINLSGS